MAIVVIEARRWEQSYIQLDGDIGLEQIDLLDVWLDLPTTVDGLVLRGGCGPNTWSV